MSKLNELELKNDIVNDGPNSFEELPHEQIGGQFPDPPQPGSYRIRFPQPGAISESWDTMDTKRGQRIVSKLQDNAALTIIQSPGGRMNGDTVGTRISNGERQRGKDPKNLASDMDYTLVVTKYQGKKPKFGDNRAYADAFLSVAGKEIGIDWEFQWNCRDDKPIRVEDPVNGVVVLDGQEGRQLQLGCGTRYYQKDVDREPNDKGEMIYPIRIGCANCGALLRAFGQIARFRE